MPINRYNTYCPCHNDANKCICEMQPYRVLNNNNYSSYGKWTGKFDIEQNKLFDIVLNNTHSSKYAFIEKRSGYFKLFIDLDFKGKSLEGIKLNTISIINSILNTYEEVLNFFIKDCNKNYVYSDRSDYKKNTNMKNKGAHIFYTNVIINDVQARIIRYKVIRTLEEKNEYGFSSDQWRDIIDESIYKGNGMKILFQTKILLNSNNPHFF